ncbi:ribose transport system permease protein [Bacillus sp. SORGH_AS 510]|uniref:ABC transporter permease n=1 Tax=Bacillus sp. SORGH_AS_0510 TaxID=3041771 RepID=UPI002783F7B9|nr:ABC transporter permease [Bacillus sp. SORGH_AS_0510]MDQ1143797.1 ribose transport system permease protein [Bacillus sp. SORGH_AS_0510]
MEQQPSTLKNLTAGIRKSGLVSITLVLILLIIIASTFSPYFLDAYNLQSLIRDLAFISIIALGQACLMIIGEIDLSVGKIASLCGVLGGMLMVTGSMNPYVAFVLCLILGGVLGAVNGTIVTSLKLNSIVVTIGMTGVYGGINLVLTKGKAIMNIPESIYFLGQGSLMGIPMPFVIMVIVLVAVLFLTKYTQFGRYMYAIGNSPEAAKILGIKVQRIRTMVFVLVGFLSALAGMLMVARLGTAQPSIGETWALNSIAASVIGGIALTGGMGNPFGAILGAAIISVIQNIIVLFGVSPYWQTAVSGVIVVLAISFNSITTMLSARKKRKTKTTQIRSEAV